MSPCPAAALCDRRFQRRPVALGHHRQDRTLLVQHAVEGTGKARIAARDAAELVDGRNRHRRILEEAHEAHFGRALRIAAVVLGAVEHQRARDAGRAVGAERHLMKQPHRHRLAGARLEVEIEHFGFDVAGRGIERGQQRRAFAGDNIGELERADADLRQILIEPGRQRGVEINDVAGAIDREEAGRRVVEIIDGVLEFLEHVFLAGRARASRRRSTTPSSARRAGSRPAAARACAASAPLSPSWPATRTSSDQPPALARRLQQPEDRFRHVRIADEHPLDRPHVVAGRLAPIRSR